MSNFCELFVRMTALYVAVILLVSISSKLKFGKWYPSEAFPVIVIATAIGGATHAATHQPESLWRAIGIHLIGIALSLAGVLSAHLIERPLLKNSTPRMIVVLPIVVIVVPSVLAGVWFTFSGTVLLIIAASQFFK